VARSKSRIGGCHVGDWVTFYTSPADGARSVTGKVIRLEFGETQGDYATVYLDVDGMTYAFGTGGHLGETWTSESGQFQWFKEVK